MIRILFSDGFHNRLCIHIYAYKLLKGANETIVLPDDEEFGFLE